MNVTDFLRVAPFINDCPSCGNDLLGNGEGTLNVEDNLVVRTCKCNFKFEYDVSNGTSKAKMKKVVAEALKQMNEMSVE